MTEESEVLSPRRRERPVAVAAGFGIIAVGVVLSPLPLPLGLPCIALGTLVIVRNSTTGKRAFARLARRYPVYIGPLHRFLHYRRRHGSRPSQ